MIRANSTRLERAVPPRGVVISDALVFFGATGDLAYKQIFPALQQMIRRDNFNVPIVGVAKSGWTIEQLKVRVRDSLTEHGGIDEAAYAKLIQLLQYIDGDYQDPATFEKLRTVLGQASAPLHYLAIPPVLFETVVEALNKSGCARNARVIVEKPFGRDRASARKLNATLRTVFAESAIYRIDHFLGKEAVEDLYFFRFANTFLEPTWNRHYIDHVQITMAESFGIAGRGPLYDQLGAIRDVVQNHLLQVVALLAMEPPTDLKARPLHDEQYKIFRATTPISVNDCVRGQFEGYRSEKGVAPDSDVETYAAVRLYIDSWRWAGVPFLIRAGKCLPVTATEVFVRLKKPPLRRQTGDNNYFRFRLGPEFCLNLGAQVKRPGPQMVSMPVELSALEKDKTGEDIPYERLLTDAMHGNKLLFVREDAVEAAWMIVEPLLGNSVPLHDYKPGTWGPEEADLIAADVGGWRNPER
ncbi:MAG TPA: glucose-6-phosphate dehydrogenase [Candidatus Dormibacteraeota bacterium]|nr:glucose-6-phosphate dehydrogenase [Candidatus Dormibacteraeota bacterium]